MPTWLDVHNSQVWTTGCSRSSEAF